MSADGYLSTNAHVSSHSLLELAGLPPRRSLARMSVQVRAAIANLAVAYPIEVVIQSTPHVENFEPRITLVENTEDEEDADETTATHRCVYTYRFDTDVIARFVRVDRLSSAHLEADFKFDTCVNSFFIYNNGCMAIKWESAATSHRCQMIKAGEYKIEFKLCFYDSNKVS